MKKYFAAFRVLYFVLAFIAISLLCIYYKDGPVDPEDESTLLFGRFVINGFFNYIFIIAYTMTLTLLFFKDKVLHAVAHVGGTVSIFFLMVSAGIAFPDFFYGIPTFGVYIVFSAVAQFVAYFCMKHILGAKHFEAREEIPLDQII